MKYIAYWVGRYGKRQEIAGGGLLSIVKWKTLRYLYGVGIKVKYRDFNPWTATGGSVTMKDGTLVLETHSNSGRKTANV